MVSNDQRSQAWLEDSFDEMIRLQRNQYRLLQSIQVALWIIRIIILLGVATSAFSALGVL